MKEFIIGCIGVLIFVVACAAFEGWIISWLWNWLAPLFWTEAPTLSIWEAFGIMVLINMVGRLIFGSNNK